jgi:4-amino-4-deoxy-L-arabinose transferase-like glycosyltransferase
LLLAGLGWLGDLPEVSRALGAVAWAAAVLLTYVLGRKLASGWAGLVAAGLLSLSPLVLASLGMETPLYLCMFAGAVACYLAGRGEAAALFLALLVLTRPDGILLAALLFSGILWSERRLPWRTAALFVTVAAPWYLFATWYYGSPFPNSLAAKMGQAATPGFGGSVSSFLSGLAETGQRLLSASPAYALLALPLLVSLLPRHGYDRRRLIFPAWMALYVAGYALLGVVAFPWYSVGGPPGDSDRARDSRSLGLDRPMSQGQASTSHAVGLGVCRLALCPHLLPGHRAAG